MTELLHVGVMGAGSIGCFVGGMLEGAGAARVTFVGRERVASEVREHGMRLRDLDRPEVVVDRERVRFETSAEALSESEVVLCCVKSAGTEAAAAALARVLRADAVVVSLQNGVRNAGALRVALGDRLVLPGIVGFNAVSRGDGVFHRGLSGAIVIERSADDRVGRLVDALRQGRLGVETPADIAPHQWTKLLVNLNNAVSALSGAPTRELLLSPGYRRIVAAIIDEGLDVLRAAGIRPASLRGVPVGLMPGVLRLPTPLVRLVTCAQMRVDLHAKSSMWEDLTLRRPTEVDYLNGEIVSLGDRVGVDAKVNRRVVELVRDAERAASGPPGLPPDELARALGLA